MSASYKTNRSKTIIRKLSILCIALSAFLFMSISYSNGMVITAKKVTQDLPLDPEASVWVFARATEIPLASQVITRPRHYEASVKEIKVRAIHNSKEIAFLLEWKDNTKDSSLEIVHTFSDAVALQFPSEDTGKKPHFAMGHEEAIVNIWNWKAVYKEVADKRVIYATVDDFLAGVEADNPVSRNRISVQNLQAGGFGTLTELDQKALHVLGVGKWESDTWKVVLKRSIQSREKYEAKFEEGGLIPIAIAVWDGSKGERGGRKSFSTWYYLALETETQVSVYIFPIIAFLGMASLLTTIILYLRRRAA